jgi:hypothetical protein
VRERLTDYSLLADGGRAVTLVGAPGPISHQLEFHNSGEQRAILRQATLVSAQLEAAAGHGAGVMMPSVVLHPGQARRVPIRITIPPHTPPGRYEGELLVAGQTVEVVIHVVEIYDLEIAPTEVVLENRAGDRTVRQLVCTNRGNVPLVIGEIGAVVLDDELTNCRSLRAVTAAWPDADGQHDAVDRFVDLFVKEGWKKVVEHSGVLRVHTAGGPQELSPGETQVVNLEITLPDKLEPRTRYTGFAPLYTSDVTFRIVPVRGRPDAGAKKTQDDAAASPKAPPAKRSPKAPSAKRSPRTRKSAS